MHMRQGFNWKMSASARICLPLVDRSFYFKRATFPLFTLDAWVAETFESACCVPVGSSQTFLATLKSVSIQQLTLLFPLLLIELDFWAVCVKVFPWVDRIPAMLTIAVACHASGVRSMNGFSIMCCPTVGWIRGSTPFANIDFLDCSKGTFSYLTGFWKSSRA